MKKAVKSVLRFVYYHSRLLGLMPFEYDFQKNTLCITKGTTIYSLSVHAFILILLPYGLCSSRLWSNMLSQIEWNILNLCIAAVTIIRVTSAITSIILNWKNRKHFLIIFSKLKQLQNNFFCNIPQQLTHNERKQFEERLLEKCAWSWLTEVFVWLMIFTQLHSSWTTILLIPIIYYIFLNNILMLVMNHYFLAEITMVYHYRMLNSYLQHLITGICNLQTHNCTHYKQILYLQYAKDLHDISVVHGKLHALLILINKAYHLQGAFVMLCLYATCLGNMYVIYTYYKIGFNQLTALEPWSVFSLIGTTVCYYRDLMISSGALNEIQNLFQQSITILREQTPVYYLNQHLERSVC